jgi:hypothetical protein
LINQLILDGWIATNCFQKNKKKSQLVPARKRPVAPVVVPAMNDDIECAKRGRGQCSNKNSENKILKKIERKH